VEGLVQRSAETSLWERVWYRGDCQAVAVMVHGIQSHSGWYVGSAGRLAAAGASVVVPDRRGSGMNAAARGDTPNHRVLLEDLRRTVHQAQTLFPRRPLHLIGISWGGKLATAFALRYPHLLRSLILVAPGLASQVDLGLREKCRVLFWRFWKPERRFLIPLSDPELFTANPERRRYIAADALSLKRASARFFLASRSLDMLLCHQAQALRLPVLLFLAGQDRIVDNRALRRFFAALPDEGKRLVHYPEAHHTLEFEPEPGPFFEELVRWVLEMR
jgi:alpha-beta hydrolase superfamily lysophospholipase